MATGVVGTVRRRRTVILGAVALAHHHLAIGLGCPLVRQGGAVTGVIGMAAGCVRMTAGGTCRLTGRLGVILGAVALARRNLAIGLGRPILGQCRASAGRAGLSARRARRPGGRAGKGAGIAGRLTGRLGVILGPIANPGLHLAGGLHRPGLRQNRTVTGVVRRRPGRPGIALRILGVPLSQSCLGRRRPGLGSGRGRATGRLGGTVRRRRGIIRHRRQQFRRDIRRIDRRGADQVRQLLRGPAVGHLDVPGLGNALTRHRQQLDLIPGCAAAQQGDCALRHQVNGDCFAQGLPLILRRQPSAHNPNDRGMIGIDQCHLQGRGINSPLTVGDGRKAHAGHGGRPQLAP